MGTILVHPKKKEEKQSMGAIERFQEVVANRHQYAQEWKQRKGGRAVGWICTYVPEEIIYASGMLPVRILGSH
ncbi:MAG: hypothetical protein V3V32_05005, partial [Dehalococcoidia bacterium]